MIALFWVLLGIIGLLLSFNDELAKWVKLSLLINFCAIFLVIALRGSIQRKLPWLEWLLYEFNDPNDHGYAAYKTQWMRWQAQK